MVAANVVAMADFEARPRAVAAEEFREVMREWASGVALVTSAFGQIEAGCAVSSFTSLSLDPASLLVCLNGESATLDCIRSSGLFAINVLKSAHLDLARRFASSKVHGAERFAEGDWGTLTTGAPTLHDALAVMDCRLERVVEHATHAIVIGTCVTAARGAPAPALLHWRSRFETLG
jgi:flavin reductase (DIM6/NTAB) family NADH-FMN oxidoreductase RutF